MKQKVREKITFLHLLKFQSELSLQWLAEMTKYIRNRTHSESWSFAIYGLLMKTGNYFKFNLVVNNTSNNRLSRANWSTFTFASESTKSLHILITFKLNIINFTWENNCCALQNENFQLVYELKFVFFSVFISRCGFPDLDKYCHFFQRNNNKNSIYSNIPTRTRMIVIESVHLFFSSSKNNIFRIFWPIA